jgi:peptidoglycan/xylan/chitin deacetylase (PgdA/CDA1 family)
MRYPKSHATRLEIDIPRGWLYDNAVTISGPIGNASPAFVHGNLQCRVAPATRPGPVVTGPAVGRLGHASIALFLVLASLSHPVVAGEPPFEWPDGRKAAISLAYDDALDSQLDNAIPALDRHGLKGSFYLVPANMPVGKRLDEWRRAAAHGHELGNHTLFHQCSGSMADREWVEPQRDLDHTTAAQMKDQVLLANVVLAAIDGRHERTMTVPCGDAMASGQDYVELVRGEFVAIKLGNGAVTPGMQALDPYAVTVVAPVDASGEALIAIAREAAAKGTMANFTFHGIGGDYLSVSSQAHEALLDYLASNRQTYWTATFIDIMKYVRQHQAPAAVAVP